MSLGSKLSQGKSKSETTQEDFVLINNQIYTLLENEIQIIEIVLPPKGSPIRTTLKRCRYHNLLYIVQSVQWTEFYKALKPESRINTWILTVGSNNLMTPSHVL